MRRLHLLTFLFICFLLITNCSLPQAASTPTAETSIAPTSTVPPPLPTPELGQAENPLILTLPPSANSPDQVNAAKLFAEQLSERTGYLVVVSASDSYISLVDALDKGNADIVLLDALSYESAYQKGLITAAFVEVKEEKTTYGSQFVASRESGFIPYYDPDTQTNTADASIALAQFIDKKPCWTDGISPSGYIVPFGYLNKYNVVTKPAAFVQGHPTVIRSLYAGGICDFGATYIDARKFPSLEDQYPDLMEQILVIWQIPEIIPYNILAFSNRIPETIQTVLRNAIPAILQTDEGKNVFKTAFDIDKLTETNDASYETFHDAMKESGLDLSDLTR